jgi:hypothetical protein
MNAFIVLAIVLLALWLAAAVTHVVVSAAIHILLGAAVVLFIIGLVLGRKTAT